MANSSSSEEQAPPKEFPGRTLRKIREQAGVSLGDISEKTLISISRLEALEQDDYLKVGGTAYITGYARAYAKTLGIDPQPFIAQLERVLDVSAPVVESGSLQNISVEPTHKNRQLLARLAMIVIVLIVVLVLYLLIGRDDTAAPVPAANPVIAPLNEPNKIDSPTNTEGQTAIDNQQATDEPLSESQDIEGQSAAETSIEGMTSTDTAAAAADTYLGSTEPVSVVEESLSESGAEVSGAEPNASLPSLPKTESQIELSFTEACWVQVWDANGKLLIAQTANSGDNLQLFGPAPFEVKLGFAEAATIKFNGKTVEFEARPGHRTHRMTVGESQ